MSWLILCFKTLHALLLSALLCFFTIWIFPSHPKTPSLSLSLSLSIKRVAMFLCALLQFTHKQNEKNKEAPSSSNLLPQHRQCEGMSEGTVAYVGSPDRAV